MLCRQTIVKCRPQSSDILIERKTYSARVLCILDPIGIRMTVAQAFDVMLLGIQDELAKHLLRCSGGRTQIFMRHVKLFEMVKQNFAAALGCWQSMVEAIRLRGPRALSPD